MHRQKCAAEKIINWITPHLENIYGSTETNVGPLQLMMTGLYDLHWLALGRNSQNLIRFNLQYSIRFQAHKLGTVGSIAMRCESRYSPHTDTLAAEDW
jgi:hypothetical protein